MNSKLVSKKLDLVARKLHQRGEHSLSRYLCDLRDFVASGDSEVVMSKHASKLDSLARAADSLGLATVASELCRIRDVVESTALEGPEDFKPVNHNDEGYPDHTDQNPALDYEDPPEL